MYVRAGCSKRTDGRPSNTSLIDLPWPGFAVDEKRTVVQIERRIFGIEIDGRRYFPMPQGQERLHHMGDARTLESMAYIVFHATQRAISAPIGEGPEGFG